MRRSPLPHEALKERARAYVKEQATAAAHFTILPDGTFPMVYGKYDGLQVIALVAPDLLIKHLDSVIENFSAGVSASDRAAREAELTSRLSDLEHAEEALIVAAAGDGITLDRRPHANPLAVLGVTFDRAAATARAS